MTKRHLESRITLTFRAAMVVAVTACAPGLSLDSMAQPASDDETVTVEFRPRDDTSGGHPFVFSFHGKQFDEPLWLISAEDEIAPLTPVEEFLRAVIETNGTGAPEDLLALWNPDERPAVFADLGDEQAFARNRSFFRNVERAGVLAELMYGEFTIFVVLHSGTVIEDHVQLYPVLRSAEGYFLTNRLQEDPILQFVFLVYEDRLAAGLAGKRDDS